MKADIKEFVKKCLTCQKCKVNKHNKTVLTNFNPKFPERWASVHIDTVGEFEESYGYRHILTIADRFTNYQVLAPLENLKAETVSRAILLHWIVRFGVPYEIICDNAQSFLGAACKRLIENLGCKLHTITSYSPYKNGFIESRNRSLKTALRSARKGTWYETMCIFNMAYNSNVREETQASPFMMAYGTGVRLPCDMLDSNPKLDFTDRASFPDKVKECLVTKLSSSLKLELTHFSSLLL